MVKVVHLLAVAAPALSVKVEDPQALLQLANAHRGGSSATQNLKNAVASMESRVSAMVQEKIAAGASGSDPSTPSGEATVTTDQKAAFDTMDTALDAIVSSLHTEKDSNQGDWDLAVGLVAGCNTAMDGAFTGVNANRAAAEQLSATHNTCRGVEDTDRNDEYTKHGTMVSTNAAMVQTAASADSAKPPCHTGTRTPNQLLGDLGLAKQWADDHTADVRRTINEYTAAKKAHTAAETKATDKAADCDSAQKSFESKFCTYKGLLDQACQEQTSCVDNAQTVRDTLKPKLEEKITAEKLILKSCGKVRCYIDLLEKDRAITQPDYATCNALETDDSVLDIVWTAPAAPGACDTTPANIAPGDATFPSQNSFAPYTQKTLTWLEGKTGVEPVKDVDKCNGDQA